MGDSLIKIEASYLDAAGLAAFPGPVEGWQIGASNAELSYLSHGFFRYYGKFPPPVARRFIEELHDPACGPVVDPMAGSGTTLVEAALCGRAAVGLDVNPLAVLVAQVKTTPLDPDAVAQALAAYEAAPNPPDHELAPYLPADRYLDHWFHPAAQRGLAAARRFVETAIDAPDVRDFFRVALAAIVRRASRASDGMGRMFLDPALPPPDVPALLGRKIRQMLPACAELRRLRPQVTALLHDAQEPFLTPACTGLAICHPPYFNLYRYSSIYKYELLWLGFGYADLRPRELREGFKHGQRALVEDYLTDLLAVLRNCARALAPGGWCVLMMGDTMLRGERVNTTALTLERLAAAVVGLCPRRLIVRLPKYTEASYAAAQRRPRGLVGVKMADHLVVLEKVSGLTGLSG